MENDHNKTFEEWWPKYGTSMTCQIWEAKACFLGGMLAGIEYAENRMAELIEKHAAASTEVKE